MTRGYEKRNFSEYKIIGIVLPLSTELLVSLCINCPTMAIPVSDLFSAHLFWDLPKATLDIETHKTIIIERVVSRGDIDDMRHLKRIYGIDTIKKEIVKAGSLDKKTFYWISKYLKIPKASFLCYTKTRFRKIHWNC